MADEVATYIVEESLAENVEYSAKTKSFKLKINVTDAPESIAAALGKCTKATSTVFGGQLGVRVRLLPSSLLSTERVSQLRSLRVAIKFADAAQKMMDEKATAQKLFASEFYKQVNRYEPKINVIFCCCIILLTKYGISNTLFFSFLYKLLNL